MASGAFGSVRLESVCPFHFDDSLLSGPRTLCNACGLVYAKLVSCYVYAQSLKFHRLPGQIKKRARELSRTKAVKSSNTLGGDSGPASSDSDDVQSPSGSHGRRSDQGTRV